MMDVRRHVVEFACEALGCAWEEVGAPLELDAGLNNQSYLVTVGSVRYVFRVPGAGTELFVDRAAEKRALELARGLGVDGTYVCMDEGTGWKISRYLEGAAKLDCRNSSQVEEAMDLLRKLHSCGVATPDSFDFIDDLKRLVASLRDDGVALSGDQLELRHLAGELSRFLRRHETEPVFCHNDFYSENLLVHDGGVQLIDWEYAAMGQGVFDIASFIAQGSGYSPDEAVALLDLYLQRPAGPVQRALCLAATAFLGCYWYFWALCKAQAGDSVGAWLQVYEDSARRFGSAAREAVGLLQAQDA